MKSLVITLCVLEYILCSNVEKDIKIRNIQDLIRLHDFMEEQRDHAFSSEVSQSITQDDVTLFISTKADTKGTQIQLTDAKDITKMSPFNIELKTVFFAHGWHDTFDGLGSRLITQALLRTADVNIIMINWDTCANSIDYFVSQRCLPVVGEYVGQFIETVAQVYNYSLSDITVVGHSLGAHIAGHIGKYTNGTLGTIVGLDPAGPFFFKDIRSARLTEDDAQYVQAIHTDGLLLGVNFNVGHSDYWPNGGLTQPGCDLDPNCSHLRACQYYAESIITNNPFFARNCDSYDNFINSKCGQNYKTLMGGFNVNTSAIGTFYLDTNSASPFGMGDIV